MKKIAIQGYEGCFHQEAAQKYFGKNIEILPCATFSRLADAVVNQECDAAVMAIENSLVGSILPNYGLLQELPLRVVGESYLDINQNLMVNNGVKLEDIREVQSHQMALHQCQSYLNQHPWKQVTTDDTALSAKYISQHKSKTIAAIASKSAAEIYNLEIIGENIQTEKNNYTRFLVLEKATSENAKADANKASLSFETDHSNGALAKVLNEIAQQDINLSKLQSIPIPGTQFLYRFLADLEFNQTEQLEKAVQKINAHAQSTKIFGTYKKELWK